MAVGPTFNVTGSKPYSPSNPPPGGDATQTISVNQVGHGFSVGNAIKVDGTNVYAKAQANSAANADVVGIVVEVVDVDNFVYSLPGLVEAGIPNEAAGTVMFLSAATSGELTATAASDPGQIDKPVLLIVEPEQAAIFMQLRGFVIPDPQAQFDEEVQALGSIGAILDSGTASSGTATTLADTSKTWTTDQFAGDAVRIVAGTGAGQRRIVSSNTADTLTVSEAWDTNPDNTSEYEITEANTNLEIDLSDGTIVTATLINYVTLSFAEAGRPAASRLRTFTLEFTNLEAITWPAGTRFAESLAPDPEGPTYRIIGELNSAGTVTILGHINNIGTPA